jgi:DNA-binding response OmpR family regulator
MQDTQGRLVAIVDDEEAVRSSIALALQREGLRVAPYADGMLAWEAFTHGLPDLVVLDIIMPRVDGLELCRRLRQVSQTLPIIMLTSRDEELDKVVGLELGADDYLCKPFSLRELIARIRVLFRRLDLSHMPGVEKPRLLQVASLLLDLDRFSASWNGQPLLLTVTEFRLLEALVRHPGHVKTRQQLVGSGYPDDAYVSERAIDTHIKRLRQKLISLDGNFSAIETVHGLGYRYRPG